MSWLLPLPPILVLIIFYLEGRSSVVWGLGGGCVRSGRILGRRGWIGLREISWRSLWKDSGKKHISHRWCTGFRSFVLYCFYGFGRLRWIFGERILSINGWQVVEELWKSRYRTLLFCRYREYLLWHYAFIRFCNLIHSILQGRNHYWKRSCETYC